MKRSLLLLLFASSAFAQVGQPIDVSINNPSFEQLPAQNPAYQLPNAVITPGPCYNSLRARGGYPNELPPGWFRISQDPVWGSIVLMQPLPGSEHCTTPGGSYGVPQPPDGAWILGLGGATIANQLDTKPSDLQQPGVGQRTGLFTFTFWVANYFTVYPGVYEASISFGTIVPVFGSIDTWSISGHELCSTYGPATQHFNQAVLTCFLPDYLLRQWWDGSTVDPNAHLIISLSGVAGWQLLFDKTSVKFTPQS